LYQCSFWNIYVSNVIHIGICKPFCYFAFICNTVFLTYYVSNLIRFSGVYY
jgi:hypothetical protein